MNVILIILGNCRLSKFYFCILPLSNLLRLVLTEEFIDDGLKENSKQRMEGLKKGYESENSTTDC